MSITIISANVLKNRTGRVFSKVISFRLLLSLISFLFFFCVLHFLNTPEVKYQEVDNGGEFDAEPLEYISKLGSNKT